ncbi:MAG: molybdopterin-dependent oxidoreductase [Gemmatimonadota bacterium]
MSPTRRQFVWTMGAAGMAVALQEVPDVLWTADDVIDPGWAPGLEERIVSTCLVCPARCGIVGRVVDGKLIRILGNPLHPMSRGGLCPRGVAGVQLLYHPERIAGPLVREGERGSGQWREASLEEAIGLVTERLSALRSEDRSEALALLSGHCPGSMDDLWRSFLEAFGSANHVDDGYEDGLDAIMTLMHGVPRRPSYDLERSDLVLSFGVPLFESWWSPLQAFVAFADPEGERRPRARFIQVDTRFSKTAARCQEFVGIHPETYGVLALGIAYVLLRDELFDSRFVAQHVRGFENFTDERGRPREGYRSLVTRNYRTEDVSQITGVPVEKITALARTFAGSPQAVALCGSAVTQAPNGLLAAMAIHSLNVLMGRINRPGGVLFRNDVPLSPMPETVLDDTARGGIGRGSLAGPAPPFGDGNSALRFARAVAESDAPGIDALFLYYSDPLASSSHPEVWAEALAKIPFVVSFSPFLDESTQYADVIIPDLLPYERWQDAPTPDTYPYPIWGLTRPLVEPFAGGAHTGDAVLALAAALGGGISESLPYESFEALLKARAQGLFAARRGAAFGDAFQREHHRQMEERGWWLPDFRNVDQLWDELVSRGGWMDLFYDHDDPAYIARTPDGRVDLMPAALLRAVGGEGRRPYIDLVTRDAVPTDDFPLRLIPHRVSTLSSGTLGLQRWMAEQPGILPATQWEPWIQVHPETAHELGFGERDLVWVVSARGRYRARVSEFHGTAPDNVCVPYGLRHPDGELANPLQILDGWSDPLTGLPSWTTTFVRLERA